MCAKAGWDEAADRPSPAERQLTPGRIGDEPGSELAGRLLAYGQGQLPRAELSAWCRQHGQTTGVAQALASYLASPEPETVRGFRDALPRILHWASTQPTRLHGLIADFWLEATGLLFRSGAPAEAEGMLAAMCRLMPGRTEAWLMLARLQIHSQGVGAALRTLDQGLRQLPNQLDLHAQRAQWLLQTGRGARALSDYEALAQRLPQQAEVWLGLGNLRQSLGDAAGAEAAYRQGLELNADHAGLWSNLGQALQRQLRQDQAEAAYRRALALEPDLIEARNNLIALDLDRGRLRPAMQALEALLPLATDYAPAWLNAGIAGGLSRQFDQAAAAFARARKLNPLSSEPWLEEISLLLKERKRPTALELAQQARRALPGAPELHWYASRLLGSVHEPAAARAAGEQALRLAPQRDFWRLQLELGWIERFFLGPDQVVQAECERLEHVLSSWQGQGFGLSEVLPELRYFPELLWNMAYLGDGPHTHLNKAMADVFDLPPGEAAPGTRSGPLRLGVLVSHLHEGLFFGCNSALPLLSRLGSDFQLVLIGAPERLGPKLPPGAELIKLPGHLPIAVETIRNARLDLLYYWEIGSDTLNYFLPFYRLAPIQLTGWGTQFSPGIPQLDYFFSSNLNEPQGAAGHYSERLLLQSDLPVWAQLPPAETSTRAELGLPPGPLYACLQSPHKYDVGFIGALAEILRLDPDAHLLLLGSAQAWIKRAIDAAMQAADIPPARVVWRTPPFPYPRFLRYLELADVVLDTRSYSGGQTADDTLLSGAPLVTYPGAAWRSRQTYGRLQLLELPAGIATSWSDYAAKAVHLAHAGPIRSHYLNTLAQNRQRLEANQAGVDSFAELLRQAAREKGLR